MAAWCLRSCGSTGSFLAGMQAGDILVVACTDPLAVVDIPTLLAQTGDNLEAKQTEAGATTHDDWNMWT
ncbi:MAG: sulfurtransferase TusA family protein [Xanthobacteraceae bacterium]